jgi:Lipocalin-like domain
MRVGWAVAVATLVAPAATAQASPANPLVGTWRPVEFVNWDSTGKAHHPMGLELLGYLIYTASGHVSLHLFSQPGPYESYVGIYSVDARHGVVNHQIEAASTPDATAGSGTRPFRLRGDTLVLGGAKTWQRVFVRVR